VWSRDGRELFFLGAGSDGGVTLMSVGIGEGREFSAGKPRALARAHFLPIRGTGYDVSPDGQRFLFVKGPDAANNNTARVVVVQNWPSAR